MNQKMKNPLLQYPHHIRFEPFESGISVAPHNEMKMVRELNLWTNRLYAQPVFTFLKEGENSDDGDD